MQAACHPHAGSQASSAAIRWLNATRGKASPCCQALEIAVVGGGIGGLAAAGRLAKAGHRVTIFEQQPQTGGRMQSVEVDGFRFDTGPSLLLFKDKYEEAFQALGTTLEEHVHVQQVQEAAYRVFFAEDCSSLDLLYDETAMATQLEAIEPGAGAAYREWLASATAALRLGMQEFIEKDFSGSFADMGRLPGLLPLLTRVNPAELLGQHYGRIARRFKSHRLQALLTLQDLYVGLSPYTAPGVFSLLAATELVDGVHYPVGGFQKVRDGLQAAAEACGVHIVTGAKVVEICSNGSHVSGIKLASGQSIAADVVLANRDVPAAYGLLKTGYGKQQQSKLSKKAFSAGVIGFNWSVTRQLNQLRHHNVFLSENYEQSWERAGGPCELQQHPNFYIHRPCATDCSAAPEGCDSIMVLLPVGNMRETGLEDYGALVAQGREAVLRTLALHGMPDIANNLQHELVIDPPAWERAHGLRHGAAFGMSHGLDQLALFRPPLADPQVAGLYFVGASTRPGNGIPLVLISARLVTEKILQYQLVK